MEQAYIYYGLYNGISFISKMIRLFNWSDISHVSAFLPPNQDGAFTNVIEAWWPVVRECHWTSGHKPGTVVTVYRVPCTKAQQEGFYRSMRAKVGARYDLPGVMSFVLRKTIGKRDRWFCSEAVFHSAITNMIVLLARIVPDKVFPAMLRLPPCAEVVMKLKIP